ncbi:hypothetical protein EDD11_002908 [Mortierella claussenii]|nr:hypothetical protein EDD11_002908 [Mortierella claussenii]
MSAPPSSNSHAATAQTVASSSAATGSDSATAATTTPPPHIRIVPHLDAPRSLHFEVVDKDIPEGFVLKIGRFTDKQSLPNRVTFKSKVVSRGHAEIFTENGKFFIRDTKSSSGTFLNHARLSPPGVESKPTPLKDGDVIQLGVDYQGGTQEIYRCVKMRLELNRSWQQQANPFRENTLKAIRSLTTANAASSTDCCICLFRIASFQSLFVAPCSHVYHYKCIRPMLISNHPGFLCPLCRTFADLEDTVEIDDPIEEEIPVPNAVMAAESGVNGHDSVEQIDDTESAVVTQQTDERASVPMDEGTAPTPPSAQAHTFQPPENSSVQLDPPSVDEDVIANVQPTSTPPSPTQPHQQSTASASATVAPMDIAGAGSPTSASESRAASMDSIVQQSPSSAFLLAPSPPMFVSSFGVTPIPFAASASSTGPSSPHQTPPPTQSPQQQHHHTTPSSPSSHVSHMIQTFVRNITIPHRNRSRTNSNSASSPLVVSYSAGGPNSHASPHGASHGHGHGQGSVSDVFGKTLVMTPPQLPPMQLGNHRSMTGSSGMSELGVVSEMDVEPSMLMEGHETGHGSNSSGGSSRSSGSNSRSSSQSRIGASEGAEGAVLHAEADTMALQHSQTLTAEASV